MEMLNKDYIEPIISGSYEVRVAKSEEEIIAAQKLRYEYLIKEYTPDDGACNDGVNPTDVSSALKGIDQDEFDKYCAHLIVINHELEDENKIIATYRIMRKSYKDMVGRWYSQAEFNLDNIMPIEEQTMELGRATVHVDHRNNTTLKMLWYGIGAFIVKYNLRYMIGTASFKGEDISKYISELSFLKHFCAMPDEYMAYAQKPDGVEIDAIDKESIDPRRAIMDLPAIIKGYLKTGGCSFSTTAFIDKPFGCIDVLVFFDAENMHEKYAQQFLERK